MYISCPEVFDISERLVLMHILIRHKTGPPPLFNGMDLWNGNMIVGTIISQSAKMKNFNLKEFVSEPDNRQQLRHIIGKRNQFSNYSLHE